MLTYLYNIIKYLMELEMAFINPFKSGGLFHPYILEESMYYLRGIRWNFLGLFGSRQKLLLANSADPDQMQHYALGLHCLPMYPFQGFPTTMWIFVRTVSAMGILTIIHTIHFVSTKEKNNMPLIT